MTLIFKTDVVPNPKFNPVFQDEISARTRLAPGITMAKFLGSKGDPVTMNHIVTDAEKKTLAKQYYLHAEAMKTINDSKGIKEFEDYRLEVLEGLYIPNPNEKVDVSTGINHLLENGQAVVYVLRDTNGRIALDKTFDLAVYWKDNLDFEKMILDYDNYNPDESLHACIILIMPQIVAPWNVTYNNQLETRFNNNVQATNELIEVLDPNENFETLDI